MREAWLVDAIGNGRSPINQWSADVGRLPNDVSDGARVVNGWRVAVVLA
jgi:hypothetical protein